MNALLSCLSRCGRALGLPLLMALVFAASGPLDAQACATRFSSPMGLVLAPSGITYVADKGNHTIRAITPNGSSSVLAGQVGVAGSDDGTGGDAQFASPTGLFLEASGNLLVADSGNHRIRRVTPAGVVTTVAGTIQGAANGGGLTLAKFNSPWSVVADGSGNIYVADKDNHAIRKIAANGSVTTLAGSLGVSGAVNGTGSAARFNQPTGIWISANGGTLYVTDRMNHAIRWVLPSDGRVTTVWGALGISGSTNSNGTFARFNQPTAIIGNATYLWIAEAGNHMTRRIDQSNGYVGPGAGAAQVSGTADGAYSAARLNQPQGLAWDGAGALIIADTANHTLRRQSVQDAPNYPVSTWLGTPGTAGSTNCTFTAPSISAQPQSLTVLAGTGASFSVTAAGSPAPSFQWRKNGSNLAGATASTLALPAAQPSDAGGYDVVVTNTAGTVTSTAATLTVQFAPVITGQPAGLTLNGGGGGSFSVTASAVPAPTYQWRKAGVPLAGAIGSSYGISNAQLTQAGSYDVVVSNPVGSATSNAALLVVNLAVSASPATANLLVGNAQQFSATVAGSPDTAVTWSVQEAGGGSITAGGLYTAPASVSVSPTVFHVVATAHADPSRTAMAAVSVMSNEPAAITTDPQDLTVNAGSSADFSVVGSGPNLSYQWRRDNVDVPGATDSRYVFPAKREDDHAKFTVRVSNAYGAEVSAPAELRVRWAPEISTQPADQSVVAPSTASFTVVASGGAAPLTYQWFRTPPGGGAPVAIPGANAATYATATVNGDDGAKFHVVVENMVSPSATSALATLSVTATPVPPRVTVGLPANQSVTLSPSVPVTATFSVTATGTAPLAYQWFRTPPGGGAPVAIPDATAATYTTPTLMLEDHNSTYYVQVNNALGGENSRVATLTVAAPTLTAMTWKRDIVYLGGKEVAEIDHTGAVTVTLTDHLGTPRFVIEPNGTVLEQKFLPFGESLLAQADQARVAKGYTNHEQTDPSGLIYMQARFYGPMYHRFLSPDPARDQHFELTQSWNIYSYVMNNPVMRIDPTGMFGEPGDGGAQSVGQFLDQAGQSAYEKGNYTSWIGLGFLNAANKVLTPGGDSLSQVNARAQNGEIVSGKELAITGASATAQVLLTAAPGVMKGRALTVAMKTEAAASGGAQAVRAGQAGEAAVQAAYDIGKKEIIDVAGRARIPDGINRAAGTLSEVKNVKSLSFTSQLRDFAAYAKLNRLRFDLYVKQGAELSKPLQQAVKDGLVNLREIPK
ncbi:MAG: immunoglobulin domain-containing protein [Holophagaceae bacterium]|nr:immunoglobulin domain-containing protein [Holophagaceae bacterium]